MTTPVVATTGGCMKTARPGDDVRLGDDCARNGDGSREDVGCGGDGSDSSRSSDAPEVKTAAGGMSRATATLAAAATAAVAGAFAAVAKTVSVMTAAAAAMTADTAPTAFAGANPVATAFNDHANHCDDGSRGNICRGDVSRSDNGSRGVDVSCCDDSSHSDGNVRDAHVSCGDGRFCGDNGGRDFDGHCGGDCNSRMLGAYRDLLPGGASWTFALLGGSLVLSFYDALSRSIVHEEGRAFGRQARDRLLRDPRA